MKTALYYPHLRVRSPALVKTALLTWDNLEYIVPWEDFRPSYADKDLSEAMELIGRAREPSESERKEVHSRLEALLAKGIPTSFEYDARGIFHGRGIIENPWQVSRPKLSHQTWAMLEQERIAADILSDANCSVTPAAGLTIMAILADVMAGKTRARLTDRGVAYAAIANTVCLSGSIPESADGVSQIAPLTFKNISADKLDLRKVIELRKRELTSSGHDYRALRHKYLAALEDHLLEASKLRLGSSDRQELDRQFVSRMEDDFREIKDELGFARSDVLFSKDTMTFVLAAGALATAVSAAIAHGSPFIVPGAFTIGGAAATIGGVLGVRNRYGATVRGVLRSHPMAYLYELAN